MPKGIRKEKAEEEVVIEKVEGSSLLPYVKSVKKLADELDETNKKVGSDLARQKGQAAIDKLRSALVDIIEGSAFDA